MPTLHGCEVEKFCKGARCPTLLPRDTSRCEIVCRLSVRLSDCPTVTFMYHDHIGWNSSKIIARPNSLGPCARSRPTSAIWCNGNTPKITVE